MLSYHSYSHCFIYSAFISGKRYLFESAFYQKSVLISYSVTVMRRFVSLGGKIQSFENKNDDKIS